MIFNVKRGMYSEEFEGSYGQYLFEGTIMDDPSEWGIANSRIVGLNIYSGEQQLVSYWDEWEYGKQYFSLYHPIVTQVQDELEPLYEEYRPSIVLTKEKKQSFWGRFFK